MDAGGMMGQTRVVQFRVSAVRQFVNASTWYRKADTRSRATVLDMEKQLVLTVVANQ